MFEFHYDFNQCYEKIYIIGVKRFVCEHYKSHNLGGREDIYSTD